MSRPNLIVIIFAFLIATLSAQKPAAVLTRNYKNDRTGVNTSETILTAANVNGNSFGKLFTLFVDDQVFAGTLYVPHLTIKGSVHNVVFAATTNNSIYAFDADTLQSPLWYRNFNNGGRPTSSTEVGQNCGAYHDFQGDIGIIGTPVIDPTSGLMYFVSRTVESGQTYQRLHAISILDGLDSANSPQVITASVAGRGDGGSTVTFNAVTQNQRPGLSLSKNFIYIAWSSFCDTQPYHGWVLAYDKTALTEVGAFNATPNGAQAGIWGNGAAPAFDEDGNLYTATGNGTFDGMTGFGESVVKLSSGTLSFLDYFTPSNFNTLNAGDYDLGSSGPTFSPTQSVLIAGGKTGTVYLLNPNNLGKVVSGDPQILQEFQAVNTTVRPGGTHHIHNAMPWWISPEGINLYVWGENDYLHGFRFGSSAKKLDTTPFASGAVLPPEGMPGGVLTISANASKSGTGVIWATVPSFGDANQNIVPGNLYAFNAETLDLLYSSTGPGDDLLNFSKGSAPIVVNGKLYVGTLSNFIQVYGLKSNGVAVQNLAYLKSPTSPDASCSADQTPAKAVNGTVSGGLDDKWCSSIANAQLNIDLGAAHRIRSFIVEHAGAGGESFNLNTRAYNIQISSDGVTYSDAVTVTNNANSITTNEITPTQARYVRLTVTKPTQGGDSTTRIYEFQVLAADSQ